MTDEKKKLNKVFITGLVCEECKGAISLILRMEERKVFSAYNKEESAISTEINFKCMVCGKSPFRIRDNLYGADIPDVPMNMGDLFSDEVMHK